RPLRSLPAQALRAMRLVFLESAIQYPKSRIQNHVSALRRSSLGHGHGQAIGARMHGSAPWKTEETIVVLPRLLVLSVFSRSDSPDLVAVIFHVSSKMDGKTAFSEGDEDHDDFGAKAANSFGPFAGRAARRAASRKKPRPTGIGHLCLPPGRIPRRNCGYVPGPGTGRRFRRHCLLPSAPG